MPRYHFSCSCGSKQVALRSLAKSKDPYNCTKCGKDMVRKPQGPTAQVVEVLDNGIMSRRVERLANIEEINKERSKLKEDREP